VNRLGVAGLTGSISLTAVGAAKGFEMVKKLEELVEVPLPNEQLTGFAAGTTGAVVAPKLKAD